MSNLSMLPIANIRTIFGLEVMIETGAEGGGGIETALRAGYRQVLSCEIIKDRYLTVLDKYKNNNKVHIFHGSSKEKLPEMLAMAQNKKALFWLDAHLPNCHNPEESYVIEDILPLLDELKIIAENSRDCSGDVILIDDLCLVHEDYRSKDFDIERWTGNKGARDIPFQNIKKLFPEHIWFMDIRAEKVLIGMPAIDNPELNNLIARFDWVRS